MALLFSAVTLTGDDDQVELLVPGIPKESNDLRGWTAYGNFLASIDHIHRKYSVTLSSFHSAILIRVIEICQFIVIYCIYSKIRQFHFENQLAFGRK